MVAVFIYPPNQTTAVPAGEYHYDPISQKSSFQYLPEYLKTFPSQPVDPVNFPIDKGTRPHIHNGLLGALHDSTPDLWGQMVIAYVYSIPPKSLTPDQLLLYSTAARVGNLDFRSSFNDNEKPFSPPDGQSLNDLLTAAEILEKGGKHPPNRNSLLFLHETTMGGARPKSLIEHDSSLWLAKFPSAFDQWNNARVEMATLILAQACGLTTPETKLVPTPSGDVLLLRRFDRRKSKSSYLRTGFLSGLSILGPRNQDRSAHSYLTFADNLKKYFPKSWSAILGQELFQRMVFNILIRNTDDHPQNHGILFSGPDMRLAPAFDLSPDYCRLDQRTPFTMAMQPGPHGFNADWANVLSGAAHFGLHHDQAVSVIQDMAAKIGQWPEIFSAAGVSPDDFPKFEGAFNSRIRESALHLHPHKATTK